MSLETIKARVQRITKADEKTQEVIEELIINQMDALEVKLGTDVPKQLEFVVVETSIARYNRLGSEGLKSEGIDVISQSFIEDVFEPYLTAITDYKRTIAKSSKLRMV